MSDYFCWPPSLVSCAWYEVLASKKPRTHVLHQRQRLGSTSYQEQLKAAYVTCSVYTPSLHRAECTMQLHESQHETAHCSFTCIIYLHFVSLGTRFGSSDTSMGKPKPPCHALSIRQETARHANCFLDMGVHPTTTIPAHPCIPTYYCVSLLRIIETALGGV